MKKKTQKLLTLILTGALFLSLFASIPSYAAELGDIGEPPIVEDGAIGEPPEEPLPDIEADEGPICGGRSERLAYIGSMRYYFGEDRPLWEYVQYLIDKDGWEMDEWFLGLLVELYPDESPYPPAEEIPLIGGFEERKAYIGFARHYFDPDGEHSLAEFAQYMIEEEGWNTPYLIEYLKTLLEAVYPGEEHGIIVPNDTAETETEESDESSETEVIDTGDSAETEETEASDDATESDDAAETESTEETNDTEKVGAAEETEESDEAEEVTDDSNHPKGWIKPADPVAVEGPFMNEPPILTPQKQLLDLRKEFNRLFGEDRTFGEFVHWLIEEKGWANDNSTMILLEEVFPEEYSPGAPMPNPNETEETKETTDEPETADNETVGITDTVTSSESDVLRPAVIKYHCSNGAVYTLTIQPRPLSSISNTWKPAAASSETQSSVSEQSVSVSVPQVASIAATVNNRNHHKIWMIAAKSNRLRTDRISYLQ